MEKKNENTPGFQAPPPKIPEHLESGNSQVEVVSGSIYYPRRQFGHCSDGLKAHSSWVKFLWLKKKSQVVIRMGGPITGSTSSTYTFHYQEPQIITYDLTLPSTSENTASFTKTSHFNHQ